MKTAWIFLVSVQVAIFVLFAAAMPSCGGSPLPPSSASYLGAWQSSAGSSAINCPDGTTQTDQVASRVTFSAGAGGELLEANGSCVAPFELGAGALEAAPGHTCWDRPSSALTLHVDAEWFTTGDGVTAVDVAHGRVDGLVAGVTCSWMGRIDYARGAP